MDNDPSNIHLRPSSRQAVGPFTVRTYKPFSGPGRTILILDDDLIGDAAIAAARARAIDGTIRDVEFLLVGFDHETFGALHHARGRFFTHQPYDLSAAGMAVTGEAERLERFVTGGEHFEFSENSSILGYSLSGAFALDIFSRHPVFHQLGLISPSLWLDEALEERLATALATAQDRRLFLSVGTRETETPPNDPKSMIERVGAAGSRFQSSFSDRVDYAALETHDHCGVITAAMDRAIVFLGRG